jgi:hypothetical protein
MAAYEETGSAYERTQTGLPWILTSPNRSIKPTPMPLISPVPLSTMTAALPPGTSKRFCRVVKPFDGGMLGFTW